VDSFSLRRSKGDLTGVDPVDRGKRGSKLHLAGERGDLPLSVVLSVANTADSALFEAVLGRHPGDPDAHRPPPAAGQGPWRQRLRSSPLPGVLRRRGIRFRIARRMIEPSDWLGRYHRTIERTAAWLGGWRRLPIRYERSSKRFSALVLLACSVICCNALHQPPW
jgi:transposase